MDLDIKIVNWEKEWEETLKGKTAVEKLYRILEIAKEHNIKANPKNLSKLLKEFNKSSKSSKGNSTKRTPLVDALILENEDKVGRQKVPVPMEFLNIACARIYDKNSRSIFWTELPEETINKIANADNRLEDYVNPVNPMNPMDMNMEEDFRPRRLLVDLITDIPRILEKLNIEKFSPKECYKNKSELLKCLEDLKRSDRNSTGLVENLLKKAHEWEKLKNEQEI